MRVQELRTVDMDLKWSVQLSFLVLKLLEKWVSNVLNLSAPFIYSDLKHISGFYDVSTDCI